MDAPVLLAGHFVAANSLTRAIGDVVIAERRIEFSSGHAWDTEFLDRTAVRFNPDLVDGALAFAANPNGHWAKMHGGVKETIPRGGRSLAKRGDGVSLRVYLTEEALERWRWQQFNEHVASQRIT